MGGEKQGFLRSNVANLHHLASLVASHSSGTPNRKEVARRLELKPDEALIQSLFSAQTCTLSVAQRCKRPWDGLSPHGLSILSTCHIARANQLSVAITVASLKSLQVILRGAADFHTSNMQN